MAAETLLIKLHVAAIVAMLEQKPAIAQAVPQRGGIGVGGRQRFTGGVFERDHSVASVPRMVVALVAKPAPRL